MAPGRADFWLRSWRGSKSEQWVKSKYLQSLESTGIVSQIWSDNRCAGYRHSRGLQCCLEEERGWALEKRCLTAARPPLAWPWVRPTQLRLVFSCKLADCGPLPQSTHHPYKVVVWIIWVCSENHLSGFLQLENFLLAFLLTNICKYFFILISGSKCVTLLTLGKTGPFSIRYWALDQSRKILPGDICPGVGGGAEWQKWCSAAVTQPPRSAALRPWAVKFTMLTENFSPNFQLY